MTPDEELASCEKTDRAFDVLLGQTLFTATFRLAALAAVVCAVFAAVSKLVA